MKRKIKVVLYVNTEIENIEDACDDLVDAAAKGIESKKLGYVYDFDATQMFSRRDH